MLCSCDEDGSFGGLGFFVCLSCAPIPKELAFLLFSGSSPLKCAQMGQCPFGGGIGGGALYRLSYPRAAQRETSGSVE